MSTWRLSSIRRATLIAQRGMTIVEIVITITILSILLAAGIPGFQEWLANSRVRTASDSLLNGLQVARAEAIRRNRLVSFRLDGVAGGWQVVSAPAGAVCPLAVPAADDVLQARIAQEGGGGVVVTVAPVANLGVTFTPMGLVTDACNQPFATLNMASAQLANSRQLRLTVGATGGMRMCEPSRPSTDPRACP